MHNGTANNGDFFPENNFECTDVKMKLLVSGFNSL